MAQWWKFSVPGAGTHHVRAKNVGAAGQEVLIDGALVEAPVGTTTFTGPGGTLLDLRLEGNSWALFVDGAAAEPFQPGEPSSPTQGGQSAADWWRFALPGAGTHQVRAKNMFEPGQEVLLDGAPLEAPVGTTTYTGPGGALLELMQDTLGNWLLYVDGQPAERFDPHAGQAPTLPTAVAWWKFMVPGCSGMHQVRVKNLGALGQEVVIDGAPILADAGTLTFTGPGGVLLHFEPREGDWVLLVDGRVAERFFPDADPTEAALVWHFEVPDRGVHEVRVEHAGQPSQRVCIDGQHVPGPQGQMTFTGPAATFLELLQDQQGEWILVADGTRLPGGRQASTNTATSGQCSWTFWVADLGPHEIRFTKFREPGQAVFIDGVHVPCPADQTAFTGPAGVLLELRQHFGSWNLYVDGVAVSDHNARLAGPSASVAAPARGSSAPVSATPLAVEADLPQGVSLNRDTGKYQANVMLRGKFQNLGEFNTPEEAAARYREAKQGGH